MCRGPPGDPPPSRKGEGEAIRRADRVVGDSVWRCILIAAPRPQPGPLPERPPAPGPLSPPCGDECRSRIRYPESGVPRPGGPSDIPIENYDRLTEMLRAHTDFAVIFCTKLRGTVRVLWHGCAARRCETSSAPRPHQASMVPAWHKVMTNTARAQLTLLRHSGVMLPGVGTGRQ